MIDAVLSHYMNPHTSGVSKFNHRLARELGVQCEQLDAVTARRCPLVSIKATREEVPLYGLRPRWETFDLFLHAYNDGPLVDQWWKANRPRNVYAANRVIADAVRPMRPDVIEAWCPSTIEGNPTRGAINVLTFGMAHKIQAARYEQLKTLLDGAGDYTVSVSTAIHEGSPWDETANVAERLRTVFGDRLRVLGYLADDAIAKELLDCTAVALFFDPALRANNTTFWAAIESGAPVITNLDGESPREAWRIATNIDDLARWAGPYRAWHNHGYTWAGLVRTIQEQPCAK